MVWLEVVFFYGKNMKEIKLRGKNSNGRYALVSDEDYESVSTCKWFVNNVGGLSYAVTYKNNSGILMHRFILNPHSSAIIDHKDRNPLNNQRDNLRLCTQSQNQKNRKPNINSSSAFKGITKTQQGKWRVRVTIDGVRTNFGTFSDEIEAVKMYDRVAKKYYGEYGYINL